MKTKNLAPISWSGPRPRTETELLELQATQAKAAFKSTLQAGLQELKGLVDPRPLIQEHPWKSSGAAALAGFFVAVTVSAPSGERNAAPTPGAKDGTASARNSPWSTLTSLLLSAGTDAIKSALTPWLTEKIQEVLPHSDKAAAEVPKSSPSAE